MLLPAPILTNAQRQYLFQRRHPGYDRRRKARQRASLERLAEQRLAAAQAQSAAEETRPVLMLPAPVEDPMMAELNALAASLKAEDEQAVGSRR